MEHLVIFRCALASHGAGFFYPGDSSGADALGAMGADTCILTDVIAFNVDNAEWRMVQRSLNPARFGHTMLPFVVGRANTVSAAWLKQTGNLLLLTVHRQCPILLNWNGFAGAGAHQPQAPRICFVEARILCDRSIGIFQDKGGKRSMLGYVQVLGKSPLPI